MAGLERELLVRPTATLLALGDGHCWRLGRSFCAPMACPQRGCHRSVVLLHMCALSLFSLLSSRLQQHPSLLQLSIRHAQQASQLQVIYVREDQRVEALPSMVNYYDRWVGTDLRHFSEYGIGWPNLTRTVVGGTVGLLGGLF